MPVVFQAVEAGAQYFASQQAAKAVKESAKFNSDMYKYQAKLNDQRASLAKQNGEIKASEAAERRRQIIGTGRTDFAANGLLLDTSPDSAPNLWEQGQAAELAYEEASIRNAAEAEAWGFRSQAAIDRANARMAIYSGKMAANAARLGGIGAVAGSIGSAMASNSNQNTQSYQSSSSISTSSS